MLYVYELFYGLPFGCNSQPVQVVVDVFHRFFGLFVPLLGNVVNVKLCVSEESEVALECFLVVCGK